jgi:hypothetical protein
MFDDLRQSGSFLDDEENPTDTGDHPLIPGGSAPREGNIFLGLPPALRFVITLVILFMVCALGGLCLVLTNRINLPFF